MMNKTIELIGALRLKGAPVSTQIVNSVAKGIIQANDRSILIENGGYLSLNQQWGRNVLYRMEKEGKKMCKLRGTTEKVPVAPGLLKEMKLNYQRKIKQLNHGTIYQMISLLILIKPLSYVCSKNYMLEVRGTKNVYNVFKGQKTQCVIDLILQNNCVNVYVPANLTHVFQVLDLNVNGMAKEFLNGKFADWYAQQITKQLDTGLDVYDVKVNTTLSVMKPIHARWIIGLYDYLRNSQEVIIKGFEMAGISEAIRLELGPDDPFSDLD